MPRAAPGYAKRWASQCYTALMINTNRKWLRLLILLATFAAACDPGMKIRQRNSNTAPSDSQNSGRDTLDVHVAEKHPLIGETWYLPDITLTNNGNVPITVTRIELSTPEHTYQPKDEDKSKLGQVIKAGASVKLSLWYDLDKPVYEVFRQGTEVKVYYKAGEEEKVRTLQLEGVGLDE